MPKRQRTLQPDGHTAKRRSDQQPRQRHVYLIVDDWERGYSVRKIDVDTFCDCSLHDDEAAPEPLPDPPVVRFEGHHCRLWFFGAHGTKILAMPAYGDSHFPVYDTETLGITQCSHPCGKVRRPPVLVSAAGKLYMLFDTCLAVLGAAPPPNSDEDKTWCWTFMPENLPFESPYVKSLAVHPDGRTLFVSAKRRTFSLDTSSLEWTCRGNWVMPFSDEAYFDEELDAWVGLCILEDGFGRVCSCDTVPVAAECQTAPSWKLGKDQLFYADRERHLGAKLLSMGDSRYCLLECAPHEDAGKDYPGHRVYHVTTFGLKYDKDGELRTTRRLTRSYEMTDAHELNEPYFRPVAFWM